MLISDYSRMGWQEKYVRCVIHVRFAKKKNKRKQIRIIVPKISLFHYNQIHVQRKTSFNRQTIIFVFLRVFEKNIQRGAIKTQNKMEIQTRMNYKSKIKENYNHHSMQLVFKYHSDSDSNTKTHTKKCFRKCIKLLLLNRIINMQINFMKMFKCYYYSHTQNKHTVIVIFVVIRIILYDYYYFSRAF